MKHSWASRAGQDIGWALVYFGPVFTAALTWWLWKQFGEVSLEQVAYHLNFGAEAVLKADPVLVRSFFRYGLLPAVYVTVGLRLLNGVALRYARRLHVRNVRGLGILYAAAIGFIAFRFSIPTQIRLYFFSPDYIAAHYIDPRSVKISDGRTKNLILIYVESLESEYADPKIFGTDLLKPLTNISGKSFAYRQMPGTGWTMAGIVGTECGVPLKFFPLYDGVSARGAAPRFLSNARCLSDLLHDAHYRNVFMGGASLDFAGKKFFLNLHHFDEMWGRDEWVQRGYAEAQLGGWGLHDDDLFREAKQKYLALRRRGQLFNLTLLTSDTHHPAGLASALCRSRYPDLDFKKIVQCTADQVADFVRFVQENGGRENTNFVILGDHLSMKNTVYSQLTGAPARGIFNLIVSSGSIVTQTLDITHFDLFPTLVELSGFSVAGGRLGLGYSAVHAAPLEIPADRFAQMEHSLLARSPFYARLWGVPTPAPAR